MSPPTIAAVPLELLCHILCFLPFADAVRAGAVDRGFREAAQAALARGSEVLPGRQLLSWRALWGAFRSIMEQPLERRGPMARAFAMREEALPAADQRFHFFWGEQAFGASFAATMILGVDGAPPVRIAITDESLSFCTDVDRAGPPHIDLTNLSLSFSFNREDKTQAQLIYFFHQGFNTPLTFPEALPFFSLVHTLLTLVGVTILNPYQDPQVDIYSVQTIIPLSRIRRLASVLGWDTSMVPEHFDFYTDLDFYMGH